MTWHQIRDEWNTWDKSDPYHVLVFADWCWERGVSDYYTDSWRKWLKMYGLAGFERNLNDLCRAETARIERRRRGRSRPRNLNSHAY